ncbi:MAG TPA: kelch repeat-containing protein [Pseudoduganella sp.]
MPLPPLRHLAAAALLACAALSAQAQVSTGNMTVPRMFHQASTLPDGRILLTGGVAATPSATIYASTEIYDPATGQFTPASPMLMPRRSHAAVALLDGRILVAGGMSTNGNYTNTAEIFDPATGQWSMTGAMNTTRADAAALLLNDGRVMLLDKRSNGLEADVFNPSTGLFTRTGPMVERAYDSGLVVLPDGRVLKMGGLASDGYSRNAELWDPATNQWSATGRMNEPRNTLQPVVLGNGTVLVAGGRREWSHSSTEIYDPASGQFSTSATMPTGFEPKSAKLLPSGDIVYTADWTRQLMRYQAATGTWNLTGPQRKISRDNAVARLPDGRVLITGGAELNEGTSYAAIWEPACAAQLTDVMSPDQTVAGDGGTTSFMVTAAPGCRFEADQLPSWLSANGGNLQQMPETGVMEVVFTAPPNQTGASRTASFLLANASVTVTQAASASCPAAPVVSPNPFNVGNLGASASLSVQAAATCPWSVASMPSFVTATGTTSGTGNGSIAVTVAANNDPAARSGSGQLVAMGQYSTFTFNQDGRPCPTVPTISLSTSTFPASGGTTTGTVSAATTCTWSISAPGWATVSAGATGTGNGSFTITAPTNTGAARSGSGMLTAPGVASTFNLSQAASPCATWSITPSSASIPAAGGSGSFTVTANAACTWSLGAVPSWLTLTSAGSGSGNGSISYSASANTGAARSATATFSGSGPAFSVSLNQASGQATACSAPITSGTPVSATLKSNGCPVGARGSSYYTDRYTFSGTGGKVVTIAMSSSSFDTYLYLRGPAGTVLKSDDDGGGGTNSRISFSLPSTGIYTIEATSYGSYATGAYTLSFTQ